MRSRLCWIAAPFLRPLTQPNLPKLRTMSSSFTLPRTDPPVTVNLVRDLSQDQLLSFPAFKTWLDTLQHSLSTQTLTGHPFHSSPYKLRRIDIQTVDSFGGSRIGFVKLKAEVSSDDGQKLPGSVFLRGGSVGMMVRTLGQLFSHVEASLTV